MEISSTELGSGSYGKVLYGKINGETCAVKTSSYSKVDSGEFCVCVREIIAANAISNTFVQPITHVGINDKQILLFSPIRACSLTHYIRKNNHRGLSHNILKQAIYELVVGLKAIHSTGNVHRDIKPCNILVDNLGHMYYTDFGSSRFYIRPEPGAYTNPTCTATTRSPEEFLGLMCGFESDLWCLGMTILFMTIGTLSFPYAAGEYRNIVVNSGIDCESAYFAGYLTRMMFPTETEWPEAWTRLQKSFPLLANVMRKKIAKRPEGATNVGYLRRILRNRKDLPTDFFNFLGGFLQGLPTRRMNLDDALCHPYFADIHKIDVPISSKIIEGKYKLIDDMQFFKIQHEPMLAKMHILENHPGLNEQTITILKSWLCGSMYKYKLNGETFVLGLELIDRYLSHSINIKAEQLLLVGTGCMELACCANEVTVPTIRDWVYSCEIYTYAQIDNMIKQIFMCLHGQLIIPGSRAMLIAARAPVVTSDAYKQWIEHASKFASWPSTITVDEFYVSLGI